MSSDAEQPAALPDRPAMRPSRPRTRISAACVRCQKRKIRCDTLLPACGACRKAGVPCVGSGISRETTRSYVTELEARIEWLESIVRNTAPNVDLTGGPGSSRRGALYHSTDPCNENAATASPESDPIIDNGPMRGINEQIGLISIASGTDLRYLGPSSGIFFTRFVLKGLRHKIDNERCSAPGSYDSLSIPPDLLVVQPKGLPQDQSHARWLSQAYFDNVHLHFPFLYKPTHLANIADLYNGVTDDPLTKFQVFMVLAIGATILSRRAKVSLSAESYCASAMALLDRFTQITSLRGIQCILLLQMYALNNPSCTTNLWTLHYHGLSLMLELGLQRDIKGKQFTDRERELRTRIFWCTYAVDRLMCTLLGRPIGVIDEQCEFRLPLDINDSDIRTDHNRVRQEGGPLTNMSSAIHLCKVSRLNSEVKCVLYCVDRQYPPYTQPIIPDVVAWKTDMLQRLRKWKAEIPQHPDDSPWFHMNLFCEIRYHEIVMLVLRPNPRFQDPDKAAIRECFSSAIACSNLYNQLYKNKSLHYGWISVHSLFLCVIVMFYCVWTPHGVADEVVPESLMQALKAASDVLSAMGEYWPEAARSRNILD